MVPAVPNSIKATVPRNVCKLRGSYSRQIFRNLKFKVYMFGKEIGACFIFFCQILILSTFERIIFITQANTTSRAVPRLAWQLSHKNTRKQSGQSFGLPPPPYWKWGHLMWIFLLLFWTLLIMKKIFFWE